MLRFSKNQYINAVTAVFLFGVILTLSYSFLLFHQSKVILAQVFNPDAEADQSIIHSLHGWAWNDAIGWLSFNSSNCDINGDGNPDGIGNCLQQPGQLRYRLQKAIRETSYSL